MSNRLNIDELNINEILSSDQYVIPAYQRNYAWDITEVTQLIKDIADYAADKKEQFYYLGNLVVYINNDTNTYETVDGQQRLTTLNIIACVLKGMKMEYEHDIKCNLSFKYRDLSNKALEFIYSNPDPDQSVISSNLKASHIIHIYENVKKIINQACNERELLDSKSFANYFFNNVKLVRIPLPDNTDLNHYFEIMNSRGEQLEQHEILKAKMMDTICDEKGKKVFNIIWEACSNMNNYVVMNFDSEIRKRIFTDDLNFVAKDFDILLDALSDEISKNKIDSLASNSQSIESIINNGSNVATDNEQSSNLNERYESIINFAPFLLQVLKVQFGEEISLDDKKLIGQFSNVKEAFSIEFIMKLLKLRTLFDKYIIKREYQSDKRKWSLKKAIKSEDKTNTITYVNTYNSVDKFNEEIRMIQAMFHVSYPTQNYKNWLNDVLLKLDNVPDMTSNDYYNFLNKLAKSYLSKYLPDDNGLIFNNLHNGTDVENFIFNCYDFILWSNRNYKNVKYDSFEFEYRNSVEHLYPQNPIDSNRLDEGITDDSDKLINTFGNLCLITHSMNSKFSNSMPLAKKSNYANSSAGLSLKLAEMFAFISQNTDYREFVIDRNEEAEKNINNWLRGQEKN